MKMMNIRCGLGNQIYQYVFMRCVEEASGEPCMIDDTLYEADKLFNTTAGYVLEDAFGIKHPRLKTYFDPDVYAEVIAGMQEPDEHSSCHKHAVITDVLKQYGLDFHVVQENMGYTLEVGYQGISVNIPRASCYPEILSYPGDIYYYGYWSSAQWWYDVASDEIRSELRFTPMTDERNLEYARQIEAAGQRALSVHVRRTDYVPRGWGIPAEEYANMFEFIKDKGIPHPVYFFFSDDMDWVRRHLGPMGITDADEVVLVEGNTGVNDYRDMQLMSMCRGMVLANSTFSEWAARLNTRPDRVILDPCNRDFRGRRH